MNDGIIGDNPSLYKNRLKHVGYCEECDWEGYFFEGDLCPQCDGSLVSVWVYKEEDKNG